VEIIEQNLEIVVVLLVAVRQVERVLVVGRLTTHGDGRLDVELRRRRSRCADMLKQSGLEKSDVLQN
jgi:hypothetical protein